jgi:ubiquinone biosynthesis protein UbiJ
MEFGRACGQAHAGWQTHGVLRGIARRLPFGAVVPGRPHPGKGPHVRVLARILPQNHDAPSHVSVGDALGVDPYNPPMFEALQQAFGKAVMERLTLILNHVLSSESEATKRLMPHAGRCIDLQLTDWPTLMPPLPPLVFGVTPAGLLEWQEDGPAGVPDLRITLDAGNPARLLAEGLAGRRPPVEIAGDAQLATDIGWLIENLRWDVRDDLARIVGPLPAQEIARLGGLLAAGLRTALASFASLARRTGGRDPSAR